MKPVQLSGVSIGEGDAAIIVPVMGRNAAELAGKARALKGRGVDLVEWRIDYLSDTSTPVVVGCAKVLRREIGTPILATYRTREQGGRGAATDTRRVADAILSAGLADLIDVEYEAAMSREIVCQAYQVGIVPVLSFHDFARTPNADGVFAQLQRMQERLIAWFEAESGELDPQPHPGLVKVAYMPSDARDALALATAARRFFDERAELPFIALSMGSEGAFTRAYAGTLGSVATFASAGEASAPGQIALDALVAFNEGAHSLRILH